jgi:hypothetical protein
LPLVDVASLELVVVLVVVVFPSVVVEVPVVVELTLVVVRVVFTLPSASVVLPVVVVVEAVDVVVRVVVVGARFTVKAKVHWPPRHSQTAVSGPEVGVSQVSGISPGQSVPTGKAKSLGSVTWMRSSA